MSVPTTIVNRRNGITALVTKRGQLVTGPLEFSQFYTATTVANNVPVNLVEPKAGSNFIINAIILSGNRDIAAAGAVVDLYENAIGPTDATITNQIYQDEIARQTRAILTGLNIIIAAGNWVNVKSDDTSVRANIAGYYVPVGGVSFA